jgi:hypothetical protein
MTTEEQRDSVHRGRRQSDQILEGWTWNRLIKIATALSLVGAIGAGIVSFVLTTLVTRPELDKVSEKVDTLRTRSDVRFQRIEARQDAAEGVHSLLVPMARAQCIQLRQWKSSTIAEAAGLPCDSLLRRMR